MAAISSSLAAPAIPSRSKRAPTIMPVAAASASSSVSTASKTCSLSSCRSLLYASGSACRTPCIAPRCAATRGAFARSSSAASGFFFCGMIEDPELHASGSSQKPNSVLDQSTSSAPRRERWVAQVAAAPR